MSNKGFTFVELLVVIGIIGVLAAIVIVSVVQAREGAYFARAKTELDSIHEAVELYKDNNGGYYPADVNRNLPPGLEQYLAPGSWPAAAWPGSVFDWDNWDDPDTGEKIYQISIRFCPIGEPDECRFPKKPWADDFGVNSSVYYCISGPCRAHIGEPIDYPAYCVNCGN